MIDRDLETICEKALEKAPADRYQSAAHLGADLRCYLAGDPILARPPSLARRARVWARRHYRGLLTATVCLLFVLSVGLTALVVDLSRTALIGLTVSVEPSDAVVQVHAIDPLGRVSQEPIASARAPASLRLAPGHYRIRAATAAGNFAETSVLLEQGSAPVAAALRMPSLLPTGMILIPGGKYTCGIEGQGGLRALRTEVLAPFYIDSAEVSNADYIEFAVATQRPLPEYLQDPTNRKKLADRPVVAVTWKDAHAYAAWVGKRLPTAVEWECAMRYPDGRTLPWIESSPAELQPVSAESVAKFRKGGLDSMVEYVKHTLPVHSRPELATPSGLLHGATNVKEYTDTLLQGTTTVVVAKGATWMDLPSTIDFTFIQDRPLYTRGDDGRAELAWSYSTGFRCARSANP